MTDVKNCEIILKNAKDTFKLGQQVARSLVKPSLIYLHGELGAGKTTLAQGFINELLGKTKVLSPTYAYVQSYSPKKIHHFDLYRIDDAEAISELGLDIMLEDETAIRLVEWPKNLGHFYQKPDIHIYLLKDPRRAIIKCSTCLTLSF